MAFERHVIAPGEGSLSTHPAQSQRFSQQPLAFGISPQVNVSQGFCPSREDMSHPAMGQTRVRNRAWERDRGLWRGQALRQTGW